MSWDIYGNTLRRGYCEVHPHVNQEYPCSLCHEEQRKDEQERRRHDSDRQHGHDMDIMQDRINELSGERQELVTRLYNLVNVIEAIFPSEDAQYLEPLYFVKNQARETLKKLIQ